MHKIVILFIILMLFLLCFAEDHFLLLGIAYPVSQNKSKDVSTNISLSLLQNSVGEIKAFNLCGASAVCKGRVRGFQGAFFYSQAGYLEGASLAGVNVVNKSVKGVQVGAANLLGSNFTGCQLGATVNFTGGSFTGYQQSTLFNLVSGDFNGLQAAGGGNIVGGSYKGVQLGTTFNFTGKEMKGLQWSGVNVAGKMTGFQIGYINIAQKNHGYQLGLINIGEEQNGVPIGLVNLSDDGRVRWQNYISNFAGFITAVRFESNNFISTLEAGGPNLDSDNEDSAMIGFHYGYRFTGNLLNYELDFGYFHIVYDSEDDDDVLPTGLAMQLRFSGYYRINNKLEIFAGIGATAQGNYENEDDEKSGFLCFAGINLF